MNLPGICPSKRLARSPRARAWRHIVLAALLLAVLPSFVGAQVVISQVYGGGGNSGATYKNDYIELYNRSGAAIDVTGWTVQYASSAGSSWQKTTLSGTIQPGKYYLVQEAAGSGGTVPLPAVDASGSIAMSSSAGKVALVNNSTTLTGTCPTGVVDFVGFGGANCYEGSGPTATLSNTTAALRVNFGAIDTDNNKTDFVVGAPRPKYYPLGIGSADPASVLVGDTTTLTVTVTPGQNPASVSYTVTADLTAIGGPAAQPLAQVDSSTFSATVTVVWASSGAKSIPASIVDDQGRTASATIPLTIQAGTGLLLAIHDIQGSGSASPYADQLVQTLGIVTARKSNGFFIQEPDGSEDADPTTSEGIYVFTSSKPPATAAVGNMVRVTGTVQEYNAMTEIGGSPSVTPLSTGHALPTPVALTSTNPDPAGAFDQLERYEGMRVSAASLTTVGPSNSYGEFYGVVTGVRPFREPGLEPGVPALAGMPAGVPKFDGNPERFVVASNALGAPKLMLTSGVEVTGLVGPLEYAYGAYTVDPETTPTVSANKVVTPVPEVGAGEFTIGAFNMLNFTADAGRLQKTSAVIRDVMRLPDIVGTEEILSSTTTSAEDILKALAAQVNADAGSLDPGYVAKVLNTNTGQQVGFLVKSSVEVLSVTEEGKDLMMTHPDGRILPVNDRPPLVLKAKVADPRGGSFPVTVVVNHLRSLIDVSAVGNSGVFARTKRQLEAEFLAGLVQGYQANGEHVVSVGDYNAFQFNDGYVDVIGTVTGVPTPADQVLLSSPDLVNPDFTDLVNHPSLPESERYSYVENGNAQAIDHVIVSSEMLPRVTRMAFGRVDADFPAPSATDPLAQGASDHDPAVAFFSFPTADLSVTASGTPSVDVRPGSTVTYTLNVTNGGADAADLVKVTDTMPAGATIVNLIVPAGWTCSSVPTTRLECEATTLAAGASASLSVEAAIDAGLGTGNLTSTVAVSAATHDSNAANDTATVVTAVLNPPPTIGSAAVSPATLWPVNHKMIPVTVAYTATDNYDSAPSCTLGVTSNEPTDGLGDGHTATDWKVVDAHSLQLRAERSGTGNGRVYTVTITCHDAQGATSTKPLFVAVPKSLGK